MNATLKAFLVEKHGLAADADDAAAKTLAKSKVASGEIDLDDYTAMLTPKAGTASPVDRLAELLKQKGAVTVGATAATPEEVDAIARASMANAAGSQGLPRGTESPVDPSKVFGGAVNHANEDNGSGGGSNPRVKRASEQYDSTKSRKIYPHETFLGHKSWNPLAGQDVTFEGRPAYNQSQLEKAQSGVWIKHQLYAGAGMRNMLNDHEKDLLAELLQKGEFVGDYHDPNADGGSVYLRQPRKLAGWQQKAYLEDTTSGGSYLIPYFFDVDLVTYPLLYGELFPGVDLRELPTSNQVKTPTLANLTTAAGPAEDGSTAITLQTTTSLSTVLTNNVVPFTGSILIGRDMLADTPISLEEEFMKLFNVSQLQYLDYQIALGDGTTGITGIFTTSGTKTATAANSTAGPWTVTDFENIIAALPKQYRSGPKPTVWVSPDSQYFRARGIKVSSTDQRRIFGYTLDDYKFYNRLWKIENDIGTAKLGYGRLDLFRLFRRKGLQLETSIVGKTLMLLNEALIVARSRWAGSVVDANGWVLVTNAPLH